MCLLIDSLINRLIVLALVGFDCQALAFSVREHEKNTFQMCKTYMFEETTVYFDIL